MRKLSTILLAVALVLGLAQCKKEKNTPQSEGNVVTITLNVEDGNNNGSRVNVDPTGTNQVAFTDGDQILVASGGKYVGSLTKTGSGFSGSIANPVEGQKLYFYFLGNKADITQLAAGNSTTCTVNISDQTTEAGLPVISMGKSDETYPSSDNSYSARLYNKCSLQKFNVTTPSEAAICITGMNNTVTVDFSDPTDEGFEYGMDDDGVIKMHGVTTQNTETWAVVLPQAVVGEGVASTEYDGYTYIGTRPAIAGGIAANQYLDAGINMAVDFNQYLTPITFEAKTAGATVYHGGGNGDFEFSTNGIDWEPYTDNEMKCLSSVGDKISFRGNGTSVGIFQCTTGSQCYIYGNVMSLVNKTDYATTTAIPSSTKFERLFENGKAIYNHPLKTLALPATTLQDNCYQGMFGGCTNLTKAPELPAESLANNCYEAMFLGCTNLTKAPDLPAMSLAGGCYSKMFNGCTSLKTAPELPAMILANSCYYQMFYGCTSLTAAPELHAPTLVEGCYKEMFYNCSSLQSVICLATPNSSCTSNWMGGSVPYGPSHTFTKKRGTNWESGSNGIQRYWTVVEVD